MTPERIFQSKTGRFELGHQIGAGGEGAVFAIKNRSDIVAKIYNNKLSPEKASKLAVMPKLLTASLKRFTAWPIDLLTDDSGRTRGVLMPFIQGHKDIHNLYSPRSRKSEFPSADWRFLTRVASNSARAFAAVHEAGCVVGDVNHGGVIVAHDATVRLIDCDSFQVTYGSKHYLCEVGVPTFTPPELQGRSFRGVLRDSNHDCFGLAVLIFHLLFMGRHPFAGRFSGSGEMGLERAIAEHRFAYGSGRHASQMEPPPNVPSLSIVPHSIALMFERAFAQDGRSGLRPKARDWLSGLEQLEQQFSKCSSNVAHFFWSGAKTCPWCQIESTTGVILFHLHALGGKSNFQALDLAEIWKKISSVLPPDSTPDPLENLAAFEAQPTAEAIACKPNYWPRRIGIAAVIGLTATLVANLPGGWWIWIGLAIFIVAKLARVVQNPKAAEFVSAHSNAADKYSNLLLAWERDATNSKFTTKLRSLEELRDRLREIPELRKRKLAVLERDREKLQKFKYLENFSIESADIPGIGPARKAMLESYNIETAADLTAPNISKVPGFGPELTKRLLGWRYEKEQRFKFDPSKGIDPAVVSALDQELAKSQANMAQQIRSGLIELGQIKSSIIAQRTVLRPKIEAAFRELKQAEANLRVVGGK